VPVAGLGEVAMRILRRAVQGDEGVEDDVGHVESFRSGGRFGRLDRLQRLDSSLRPARAGALLLGPVCGNVP
jgi:hypothetical protein